MAWGTGGFVKPNAYEQQRKKSVMGIASALSTGGAQVQPTVPTVPVTEGNPTMTTVDPYKLPSGAPVQPPVTTAPTPTPTPSAPTPAPGTTPPTPPVVTPPVSTPTYNLFPTAPRTPLPADYSGQRGGIASGWTPPPPTNTPTTTANAWVPGQAMPYSPETGYAQNPMYANAMNTPHLPLLPGQPTPAGGWDPISQQPIWSSQQLADMAGPKWQAYMAAKKG